MIRVLVAAASPVVRAGLEAVIAGAGGYELARAGGVHPRELADAAAESEADVVVVELGPGDEFPLPLAGEDDVALRAPAVVLLAERPVAGWVAEVLRAGALAVLPRDALPEEITAAVEGAAAGLVVLPAALAVELAARSAEDAVPEPRLSVADPGLTPREREVLELLARGMGNKGVARVLGISEHTVKAHVGAVFEKLGASTRAEAVAIGVRSGLLLL
ncbi:MAG TPA: response regulator transcription factor [Longimicrobium sp.]|nr:response regulator transcription factor [Longimicrobium sp.]